MQRGAGGGTPRRGGGSGGRGRRKTAARLGLGGEGSRDAGGQQVGAYGFTPSKVTQAEEGDAAVESEAGDVKRSRVAGVAGARHSM